MAPEGPQALSRELAALKRRGAGLLVLGDRGGACRDLLGADGAERRALFVTTGVGVADVRRRWTGPETPERLGVVDVAATDRRGPETATAATVGDAAVAPGDVDWYERVPPGEPAALLAAVRAHLDRLAADGPPPATVRLCLDGLDPLVDRLEEPQLLRVCHLLTRLVRGVDGMAHVHISRGVPERLRMTLEPVFDATVEVAPADDTGQGEARSQDQDQDHDHGHGHSDGGLRQRWRLHGSGYETDWIGD